MEKKRIKLHLKKPNPLFEQWLTEMHANAVAESNPAHVVYKKALVSLRKYPLTLKSGSECGIIKGFGRKLCDAIDKKIAEYRSTEQSSSMSIETEIRTKSPKRRSPIDEINNEILPEEFDILYRSEDYAILMTIFKYRISDGSITKPDIERNIQKYCDESCLNQNMNLNASMWTHVNDLIKRDLLQWDLINDKFSLTFNGEDLIKRFPGNHLEPIQAPPNIDKHINENVGPHKSKISNLNNANKFVKTVSNSQLRKENHVIPDESENETHVVFPPNSFEVILLVDKQENCGAMTKPNRMEVGLNNFKMINFELRSLKVGDFTWIARHRLTGQELILPFIVERKRLDDLAKSIKDGRFHEQKFRLNNCAIPNIIYLVEFCKESRTGFPLSTLMQAVTNTRIQNGFAPHFTSSLSDSIKFLAMMTKNLQEKYENKTLRQCTKNTIITEDTVYLMNFLDFNKASVKTKTLSVSDLFIKQLLQLKGVSIEKALAIADAYKTPCNLAEALNNDREPELLLTKIKNDDKKSNINATISKTIYQFYTNKALK